MEDLISKAVEEYNKYRAPEVEVKVLRFDGEELTAHFGGSFCYTCGFYDYIDDFLIELRDLGVVAEIKEIIEDLPRGAVVVFRLKSVDQPSSAERCSYPSRGASNLPLARDAAIPATHIPENT